MSEARQDVGPIIIDKGVPVSHRSRLRKPPSSATNLKNRVKIKNHDVNLTFFLERDAIIRRSSATFAAIRLGSMKKSRRFGASNVEGYIVKARKIDKSRNLAKAAKFRTNFRLDGARRRTLNWR